MNTKKIEALQKQRQDAILKLESLLKDSEEGKQALADLKSTMQTVVVDQFGLSDIVRFALLGVQEYYAPTSDGKEVQAFFFSHGLEYFLITKGIIPPFTVKKGRGYGR